MSSRTNDDGVLILLIILAPAAVVAYCVWKFSQFFGLDFATGGAVCVRLFLLAVATAACWKASESMDELRLGNIWPVLLALLWVCWWPALNYYAAKDSVILFEYEDGGVWWSAWYTKWGVGLGIAGLGYSVEKWLED